MENTLIEILTKLNFLMSNTYVLSEDESVISVMDLYLEEQRIYPKEIKGLEVSKDGNLIQTLVTEAFKTNHFRKEADSDSYIIEYNGKEYKISAPDWMRYING